jgi:hypothetical protein
MNRPDDFGLGQLLGRLLDLHGLRFLRDMAASHGHGRDLPVRDQRGPDRDVHFRRGDVRLADDADIGQNVDPGSGVEIAHPDHDRAGEERSADRRPRQGGGRLHDHRRSGKDALAAAERLGGADHPVRRQRPHREVEAAVFRRLSEILLAVNQH